MRRWVTPNVLYKHSIAFPMNSVPRSVSVADGAETLEIRAYLIKECCGHSFSSIMTQR